MLFSSFIVSSIIAVTYASPLAIKHSIHEKRDAVPHGWVKKSVLDRRAILPMKVAIAQNQASLAQGHDWLMDVSHPDSKNYGKHWTHEEVAKAFAPSTESIDSIKSWLASSGIDASRTRLTPSWGWMEFNATVSEVEDLLKTKYYVYEHRITGQPHVGCEEYTLPDHLRKEHIDFVYPTVHFDTKIKARSDKIEKRSNPGPKSSVSTKIGDPGSGSLPKLGQWLGGIENVIKELSQCDKQITPWCLRALYQFPPNQLLGAPNKKNSYGIVEYTPQAYRGADLDLFFKNFSTSQVGDRPIEVDIDGGVVQDIAKGFDYNGESDLDLEYAMSLVYPQQVTLYQVGDLVEGASFDNFLDALDGSFCASDDPIFDAAYPDPYGGYQGPEQCGGIAATKVISTSYGYNEIDLTPIYEQRACNEYMKLGLLGTTFLFSSGDNGVAGNLDQCIVPGTLGLTGLNETLNNGTDGLFNPSFPSTCPYVTSVGATQVIPGTNILTAIPSGVQPEEACETVIYSGGGFSNVFPLPDWQASAVKNYYAKHAPPYGADRYNNSQAVRGYPDISANGANYVVAIDDRFALVYGTSASSPTLGSILTIINQERLNIGKPSIGFINPTLYAHPYIMNDITKGGNQGCGTPGFQSVQGWDPVTGLGTPNFPKMLALWLLL